MPLPAILSLAGRYWHLAALGVLALLLGVQTARISHIKGKHAQYVAAVETERVKAAARVITIEREATRISQEKDHEHAQAIDDLRAAAARRLQSYTGQPATVPRVSSAPSFSHEKPGSDRLLIPTADAVALMLAADENTAQLIALQDWIKQQQAAWK